MISHNYYQPEHHNYNPGYFEPTNVQFSHFNYGESAEPKAQNPYFQPAPIDGALNGQFNFEDEPPLLEELGVNFSHIIQKILKCVSEVSKGSLTSYTFFLNWNCIVFNFAEIICDF
nr:protein YIPF5 (YIP1 family) [Hymenolepis microstoma]